MQEILLRWFELVVDVSLKVVLLTAITGLVLVGARIRNSTYKHAIWAGVLLSLVVLPLLSPLIPAVPIPWPRTADLLKPSAQVAATPITVETPSESGPSVAQRISSPEVLEPAVPLRIEPQPMGQVLSGGHAGHSVEMPPVLPQTDFPTTATIPEVEPFSKRPIEASQSWTAMMISLATWIWAAGAALLLARLAWSVRMTRRLIRRSMTLHHSELGEKSDPSQLGMTMSRVHLRETSLVFVPLTAGCWRPSILLPAFWREWPQEKLGHVLVHEFSHVRRGDCWTALLAEIVGCVYWFHPVAWWLKRRLSMLAEECCDDAAISALGSRTSYARHLLEIASVLCERPRRLNYAGLAMARRSQVERRILSILDTNRPLSQRLSWYSLLLIGGMLLPLVAVTAALKPGAENAPAVANGKQEDKQTDADNVASNTANEEQLEYDVAEIPAEGYVVRGRVAGPDDKPLANVPIQIRRMRLDRWKYFSGIPESIAEVTSNADGSYEYRIPADRLPKPFLLTYFDRVKDWIQISANAPGYGIDIKNFAVYKPNETFDLKLTLDTEVRGRVLDLEGRPIAGVRVRVMEVFNPSPSMIEKWLVSAAKKGNVELEFEDLFNSLNRRRPEDSEEVDARSLINSYSNLRLLPADLTETMSDVDGRFVLRGIGAERIATIELSGPNLVHSLASVVTRPMSTMKDYVNLGHRTFYGSQFDYVISPSARIEGIVQDVETKRPLVGSLITVKRSTNEMHLYYCGNDQQGNPDGLTTAVTDANGRYRLEGLSLNKRHELKVFPPENEPYMVTDEIHVPESSGLQSVTVDVGLRKGVWVTGRVYNHSTNEPVQATVQYSPYWSNPNLEAYHLFTGDERSSCFYCDRRHQTDDLGRFRFPAIPGRGVIAVRVSQQGFLAGYGSETIPELAALSPDDSRRDAIDTTCEGIEPWEFHSLKEIAPADNTDSVSIDLPLDPGREVTLKFVDPQGNPVRHVAVHSLQANSVHGIATSGQIILSGFPRNEPITLMCRKIVDNVPRKKPYRQFELSKIVVVSPDKEGGGLTVRLEPPGLVRVKLVDPSGKPWPSRSLLVTYKTDYGKNFGPYTEGTSDPYPDSSYELELQPGCACRLTTDGDQSQNYRPVVVAEHLVPKPGEVIELGNFVVQPADAEAQPKANDGADDQKTSSVTLPIKQDTHQITGRVTQASGEPVSGAFVGVMALRATSDLGYIPEVVAETVTDNAGRYEFSLPHLPTNALREPKILVRCPGYAFQVHRKEFNEQSLNYDFELLAEELIQVRLVDIQGQPAAGVSVHFYGFSPIEGNTFQPGEVPSTSKVFLPKLTSDEQGRLTIPYVAAGKGTSLQVVGNEKFAPQQIYLNSGLPESRGDFDGTYRGLFKNFKPGEIGLVPLAPARIFEGVVLLGNSNRPAANSRITIWSSEQELGGSMVTFKGQTDSYGRFRLNPFPGVRFGIYAYPPAGSPYQICMLNDLKWQSGDEARKLEIRLPPGVMAQGQVVDAETGKPIANASVEYHPREATTNRSASTIVSGWQGAQLTDDQGRFEISVLPGAGTLLVDAPLGTDYILKEKGSRELDNGSMGGARIYAHAFEVINPKIPDSENEAKLPPVTIKLRRGGSVIAKLVDEQGKSIPDVRYASLLIIERSGHRWRFDDYRTQSSQVELHGLERGVKYPVFFIDVAQRLAATSEVSLDNPQPTIVLTPCASAKARYIGIDGKSVKAGTHLGLKMVATPGTPFGLSVPFLMEADEDYETNFSHNDSWDEDKIDTEGFGHYLKLVPGATYRISQGRREAGKPAYFVPKSGEVIDLGDVVVDMN